MMNRLLVNANVYTVNPRQPRATAIAIVGNRILAVGDNETIDSLVLPDARREDLEGAFVLPGLIDAHVHLMQTGFAMQRVNLDGARDVSEAVQRVCERAMQTLPGTWIQGWGWQQAAWGGDFPTAQQLDAATTAHPVALRAKSGHALWVNTHALRLAGITSQTPNPAGGEIVRDGHGEPSGVLLEAAMDLITRHIPPPTWAEEDEATLLAMRAMNRAGLTGVHCMDGQGGINSFRAYQRLREAGRSTLRICKQLPVEDLAAIIGAGLRSGFGDPWLRIGGVKIFADGALGSRTAWMMNPYEGEPDNFGIALYRAEALAALVHQAQANGLSVTVHAIGDRANRMILDILDAQARTVHRALRHRIEHAQVLHPDDIPRFGRLGLIASVQPIHATQDMHMVDRYWGARGRYAYAFRSLLNSGARLALGSDSPVETFNPLVGLHAAVTRQRCDGMPTRGWYPEQRLTIEEAIHGFTLGAAYAGYAERELGSVEPGKLADLTVLSADLTRIPPEAIPEVQVLRVMVDGEWVV